MLKIVYPICCGMDVHKSFVVACIASTNEQGVTTYKSKRFSTFTGNLRRCAAWLATNNCKDVLILSRLVDTFFSRISLTKSLHIDSEGRVLLGCPLCLPQLTTYITGQIFVGGHIMGGAVFLQLSRNPEDYALQLGGQLVAGLAGELFHRRCQRRLLTAPGK